MRQVGSICFQDDRRFQVRLAGSSAESAALIFTAVSMKGERGTTESLVFAEDQSHVAADLGVGNGNDGERVGTRVLGDAGAGDETNPHVGRHEAFEKFARVEFHGNLRFQTPFVKQVFERVAGVATLGHQ